MHILLVCGGASGERNISLNSARAVFDNTSNTDGLSVEVLFVASDMSKYIISKEELYSNTASDFRYLLKDKSGLTDDGYIEKLKSADLVFPLIHGRYGEDGTLQSLLEHAGVPFTASGSAACRLMYNKRSADENILKKHGFYSVPKLFINEPDLEKARREIGAFLSTNGLSEVVTKPVEGGSSIGVTLCDTLEKAAKAVAEGSREFGEMVVETRCVGSEFTVIILENNGVPVALIPSEIANVGIFDTRKKYLATGETTYHCPPRYGEDTVREIRRQAEKLFSVVGAKDFLRIDGWLLDDGNIYFSDFNPISGTEQNSFIFLQATRVGFTHARVLLYIANNALKRFGLPALPYLSDEGENKQTVNILLGGETSERNVSLMSGGNVWLKLLSSKAYSPTPYLLFTRGGEPFVQKVPYPIMLNHTVEEMRLQLEQIVPEYFASAVSEIITKLSAEGYTDKRILDIEPAISVREFAAWCASRNEYVFIGLHGGFGEDGGIQELLEQNGVRFNGCGSAAARLCMDKYVTGEIVAGMDLERVRSCRKLLVQSAVAFADSENIWQDAVRLFGEPRVVAKPNDDGCSTGVVVLTCANELKLYAEYALGSASIIPKETFFGQTEKIQFSPMKQILLEEYIQTDTPQFDEHDIVYALETGWIELTVGVLEKGGDYHAFLPSIAVAEGGNRILSLEEKFQGGTGINITPPPENIINSRLLTRIRYVAELTAKRFGISDYCRFDVFANSKTDEIIIIEINTLPGLSPSTVLFQQAAKEDMSPRELLEKIISE